MIGISLNNERNLLRKRPVAKFPLTQNYNDVMSNASFFAAGPGVAEISEYGIETGGAFIQLYPDPTAPTNQTLLLDPGAYTLQAVGGTCTVAASTAVIDSGGTASEGASFTFEVTVGGTCAFTVGEASLVNLTLSSYPTPLRDTEGFFPTTAGAADTGMHLMFSDLRPSAHDALRGADDGMGGRLPAQGSFSLLWRPMFGPEDIDASTSDQRLNIISHNNAIVGICYLKKNNPDDVTTINISTGSGAASVQFTFSRNDIYRIQARWGNGEYYAGVSEVGQPVIWGNASIFTDWGNLAESLVVAWGDDYYQSIREFDIRSLPGEWDFEGIWRKT